VRTTFLTPGHGASLQAHRLAPLASLLLFLPALLCAQDTVRISLSEALSLASARNIDVLRAGNAIRSAQASIKSARGALQPNLSLSVGPGVSYRFGTSRQVVPGQDPKQLSGSLSVGLSSGYNLYNGNADRAALAQAEALARSSEISLDRTGQSTSYTVIAAFYEVATQRDLIAVESENLVAERQVLDRVRAFVDAGTRPISDRYAEEALVAAAEVRVLSARRALEIAKLTLVELLRLDPLRTYDFPIPDPSAQPPVATDDATALVQRAYAARPEITAQQARLEAARQAIRVADASDGPTVGLSASFGSNYSTVNETFGFGAQLFSQNPSASLGLSFSLPIFDRNRSEAALEQAQISYSNEQLTMASLRQQVAIEVQQARIDLSIAQAQIDAAERQVAASRQGLDVEQTRYGAGISTLVELAQARARLLTSETQLVQARNTLELRRQTLLNALGGIAATRVAPQFPSEE